MNKFLFTVRLKEGTDETLHYSWLKENCIDSFYHGHDWDNWEVGQSNRIIQFENERDAILFLLKWL